MLDALSRLEGSFAECTQWCVPSHTDPLPPSLAGTPPPEPCTTQREGEGRRGGGGGREGRVREGEGGVGSEGKGGEGGRGKGGEGEVLHTDCAKEIG